MRSFLSVFLVSLGLAVGLAACDSGSSFPVPEICTPGELRVQTTAEGDGPSVIRSSSTVVINYVGRLLVTKDTFDTGTSSRFNLGGVIPGFRQGLVGAKIGEARTLVIPPNLGYGGNARVGIPACSTLEFEIEVLDIVG